VFGFWLSDKGKDDFLFVKEPGGKDPGPHAIRGYLPRQRVFAPKDAFKRYSVAQVAEKHRKYGHMRFYQRLARP
jgi:hypothetical protein